MTRDQLLAECVLSQNEAGFSVPDVGEFPCTECGAVGFNTGWGYQKHLCGGERVNDPEYSSECGASVSDVGGENG